MQSRYSNHMRRTGLLVLYLVATAIALGGVGDLTIRALLEVHKRFLGTADVPAATSSLVLHLLHALGGGLVGIGIASFALVHFAVRRGEGTAGVDHLHVSGYIAYTSEDAMERDVRGEGAGSVRT